MCSSREGGELENLLNNLQPGRNLPGEERQVDGVEGDVGRAGVVITLLHGGDQGSSSRPEHHNSSAGVQVGAGEKLACRERRGPETDKWVLGRVQDLKDYAKWNEGKRLPCMGVRRVLKGGRCVRSDRDPGGGGGICRTSVTPITS